MCSLHTNLRSTQTEIDQIRKARVYFEKMVNSEDEILSRFTYFLFFFWHNVISRGRVVPEWSDVAVCEQARAESHRPGCEEWLRCQALVSISLQVVHFFFIDPFIDSAIFLIEPQYDTFYVMRRRWCCTMLVLWWWRHIRTALGGLIGGCIRVRDLCYWCYDTWTLYIGR